MTQRSRAWLMDVGADHRIAAGAPHVVEYLVDPQALPVPRTPPHCAGLMIWRERMIPVIDFARPATGDAISPARRAVVLAYQDAPGQALRYGALRISAVPAEVWVSDDMAGAPEGIPETFRPLARACIVHDDRVIPILDVKRLFDSPMPEASDIAAEVITAEVPDRVPADAAPAVAGTPAPAGNQLADPVARTPAMMAVAAPVHVYDLDDRQDTIGASATAVDIGTSDWVAGDAPAPSGADEVSSTEPPDLEPEVQFDASVMEAAGADSMGPPAPVVQVDFEIDLESELGSPAELVEAATLEPWDDQDTADQTPGTDGVSSEVTLDRPAPGSSGTRPHLAGSGTLQSFARLRAIEGGLGDRARSPRRWRRGVLVAALGVAIAVGAAWALRYYLTGTPGPATVLVAHDPMPGGVQPGSVPSAPAQPPR